MELATLDGLNNLPASSFDEKEFAKVSGGRFLARLMLYGSKSEPVTEEKVPVGYSYVEGKDGFTYLGKDIDILALSWRPKAIDMSGDQIIANHDIQSDQFKAIRHKADNVSNSSCMYGPEFLVWIPAIGKFATFLMGSKTARNEAPKLMTRLKAKQKAPRSRPSSTRTRTSSGRAPRSRPARRRSSCRRWKTSSSR